MYVKLGHNPTKRVKCAQFAIDLSWDQNVFDILQCQVFIAYK